MNALNNKAHTKNSFITMFASVDNYITDTLPLKHAKVKGKEVFIDKNLPVNNVHREVFY